MEAAQWRFWVVCLSTFFLLRSCSATEQQPLSTPPAPDASPWPVVPVGKACAAFSGKTCDECIQNTSTFLREG